MRGFASHFRGGRRHWMFAGAGLLAAAGTFGAMRAHAHGWGHRGWRGDMDPESAARRIDAMSEWLLSDVDATTEQKARVSTIAKDAMKDLMPLRQQHRDARREVARLLTADNIDRQALESLRSGEIALADKASQRAISALADAAEVLNPDQRAKLADRFNRRFERS